MSLGLTLTLQGLVASGLGFVAVTGAASWIGLAPLLALTLVSPWLRRFADRRMFRAVWNLVALGFLVNLLLGLGNGLSGLLQNGLLLSALCQVHLICTLRPGQPPDLLLFNSFLIAGVTSVLSLDIAYCVIALVYVPLLVTTLRLLAANLEGPGTSVKSLRPYFLESASVSLVLLVFAALAFLFVPRDFHRAGLLETKLRPGSVVRIGFRDHVSFGGAEARDKTTREVFRVERLRGESHEVPTLFRGATATHLIEGTWRRLENEPGYDPQPWVRVNAQEIRRPRLGPGPLIRVRRRAPLGRRVFVPLSASRCELRSSTDHWPLADGSIELSKDTGHLRALEYDVELARRAETPIVIDDAPAYLTEVQKGVPDILRIRARALLAERGLEVRRSDLVQALAELVGREHRYLLPGDPDAARSLEEFVSNKGGHCEFFATALLIMLREVRVPSRLALGYRLNPEAEQNGITPVFSSDAHAWVEYLEPGIGWVSVDPTPSGSGDSSGEAGGFLHRLSASCRSLWESVTALDEDSRDRVIGRIKGAVNASLRGLSERPLFSFGGTLALILAFRWMRVRRRGRDPAVRRYLRALQRLGIKKGPAETPRQLLERLEREGASELVQREIARVTEAHEIARFARAPKAMRTRVRAS